MTDCRHTPQYPDLAAVPAMQEAISRCSIVENDDSVAKQRALTSADGQTTRIDSTYWRGLSDPQKAAVVAHERAHPAIGMEVDCEGCADKVGGFFMRAWGYAPPVVRSSFSELRVKRDREHGHIADNAAAGAKAAERAMAARGLLGLGTSATKEKLAGELADKAARAAKEAGAGKPSVAPRNTGVATKLPTAALPVSPRETGAATSLPAGTSGIDIPPLPNETGNPTSPIAPAPDGTAAESAPPSSDASTEAGEPFSEVAGDIVSAVLGENSRPHAGKVLIGAGVAAILAVVLVVIVRRKGK